VYKTKQNPQIVSTYTYMVLWSTDDRFRLVTQVWSLTPEQRNGTSCLPATKQHFYNLLLLLLVFGWGP